MSDYLASLIARTHGTVSEIVPRRASVFETDPAESAWQDSAGPAEEQEYRERRGPTTRAGLLETESMDAPVHHTDTSQMPVARTAVPSNDARPVDAPATEISGTRPQFVVRTEPTAAVEAVEGRDEKRDPSVHDPGTGIGRSTPRLAPSPDREPTSRASADGGPTDSTGLPPRPNSDPRTTAARPAHPQTPAGSGHTLHRRDSVGEAQSSIPVRGSLHTPPSFASSEMAGALHERRPAPEAPRAVPLEPISKSTTERRRDAVEISVPAEPAVPVAAVPFDHDIAERDVLEPGDREPLVARPHVGIARPAAFPDTHGAPGRNLKQDRPPEPAIQVTIGRVEVRATSAPQPPPTGRPRPVPQLSLEAYLRQRNGDGR